MCLDEETIAGLGNDFPNQKGEVDVVRNTSELYLSLFIGRHFDG